MLLRGTPSRNGKLWLELRSTMLLCSNRIHRMHGFSASSESERTEIYNNGCAPEKTYWVSLCLTVSPPPEPPPPPSPPPRAPGACCYSARQAGLANSGWSSAQQCSNAAVRYIECMDFSASGESERTEMYDNGCSPENTYWVSLCLTLSPPPSPPPPSPHHRRPAAAATAAEVRPLTAARKERAAILASAP